MDSYYFLHTRSLCGINYDNYKSGMMALGSLAVEMNSDEQRLKNIAVYDNPLYVQLFEDYAETDGILKFIEQCATVDNDIDNDVVFEANYPMKDVGFLGVNFRNITGIAPQRQIMNSESLCICRNIFLVRLIKEGIDEDLTTLLNLRFRKFTFSSDALSDMIWWKHHNAGMIDSIIELLDDVPLHPFTGGLGKTEVLSNTAISVASKRITKKDRLSYTYHEEMTTIHRCKDHY